MNENHIKEVAEMLGVELGEEFEVAGWNGKFMFDESGLRIKYLGCLEEEAEKTLYQLLNGTAEIVRRPVRFGRMEKIRLTNDGCETVYRCSRCGYEVKVEGQRHDGEAFPFYHNCDAKTEAGAHDD